MRNIYPHRGQQPQENRAAPLAASRPHTVLIVDDDPVIRRFLSMMLLSGGYKVLAAESGSQALAVALSPGGDEIDLLITDLCMPGISGTQLAVELRAMRPDSKTLFISGDPNGNVSPTGGAFPQSASLAKPFTFKALYEAIERLFASERRPASPLALS